MKQPTHTAQFQGSIQRRLIYQLAAIAALLSLVFFLSLRTIAQQAAIDTQDKILAASATSIADALYSERGAVRLELPYSALSMLGTVSEDRVFYRVIVDGQTLTGYDNLSVPDKLPDSQHPVFGTYDFKGEQVRAVTVLRAVSIDGQAKTVSVIVAQTQLGLAAISARITSRAMIIGIGFFLVATALSLLAAQHSLAPLKRLTGSVTRRGPNDLRPLVNAVPTELMPMVRALNSFMSRLRASLNRSEDLIVEAAHRVRTPLATVRTQAEVIHRQMRKSENKKALREMIRAIDESSRTAGQLLDHAMVSLRAEQLEHLPVDLGNLLRETCDRLAPTADLRDIDIELTIPSQELTIMGDQILLQSAVRNILDNAIKYSEAESKIYVQLSGGTDLQLVFKDEGRGFAEADIATLKKRFSRGSNVDDIVGSGIGLTIADDVVRAHGGRLTISANPEGKGACVTFVLPRS